MKHYRTRRPKACTAVARFALSSLRMVRIALLVISCVALTACNSPQEKLGKEISQVESLNGTLRLTAEGWLGNRVPRAFARFSVRATADQLDKEAAKVVDLKVRGAEELGREVEAVRDAAATLQRAIETGDRAALVRAHRDAVRNAGRIARLRQKHEGRTE